MPSTTTIAPNASTIVCQVCREDVALSSTIALRTCGHRFCQSCMATFLTIRIREGDAHLTCFYHDEIDRMAPPCSASIGDQEIQALVTTETYTTYQRFVLIQSTSSARECPFCGHLQVTIATAETPQCECQQCERTFCFTHGNAHTNDESCAQYEKRQARAERKSGHVVKHISRPCPACARPIEKNGGCSHMTCRVCKAQFCWHCGMKWGFDYSKHYRPLDLECCNGITEAKLPFIDSTSPCVVTLVKSLYYFLLITLAWPLTIALCWVWIPYTLWKEKRAVVRRAHVLARYLAIVLHVSIIVAFGVLVLATVVGTKWMAVQAMQGLRKLREVVYRYCCCCCPRRPVEKIYFNSFYAMQDEEVV